MPIEVVADIVEEMADRIGIYGAHEEDGDECRVCFTMDLARRIKEAVSTEVKLGTWILAVCALLPASPLLPPLPEPPALQYWYTVDIPTDSGVYPLEVFTPALPPLFAQPQIVEIGEPPKPPVHVPEPGTGAPLGIGIGCLIGYVYFVRDARKKVQKVLEELRQTEARLGRYYYALRQIEEIGGDSFPAAIARKALEEK